jgi:mannose-1-phosphate guanylyltransferase/mannose-6-phosphate isomerase
MMESISIDYAITEKSDKVITIPLNVYWNDVGSWDSIFDMINKDKSGNVIIGDCELLNCTDSFFMSNQRLITAVGIENIVIVETDDIIMVAKKGETQSIKKIADRLKERKATHEHTTVYRPWGTYKTINEGSNYVVKKIEIKPGKSLKTQTHQNRNEHWVVTSGIATAVINGIEKKILKDESVYIKSGIKHRLLNKSNEVVEIIEVQNGEEPISEDDIEIFD